VAVQQVKARVLHLQCVFVLHLRGHAAIMGSVGRLIVAGLLLALSGQGESSVAGTSDRGPKNQGPMLSSDLLPSAAVVLPVAAHSGGGTDTGTVLTRHLLRTGAWLMQQLAAATLWMV
jgi:hypothetical protein